MVQISVTASLIQPNQHVASIRVTITVFRLLYENLLLQLWLMLIDYFLMQKPLLSGF